MIGTLILRTVKVSVVNVGVVIFGIVIVEKVKVGVVIFGIVIVDIAGILKSGQVQLR